VTTPAAPRRDRYIELRATGMAPAEAAREAGAGTDPSTIARYERWYRAVRRGEHFLSLAPAGALTPAQ